jgi:hypothetical protein
MGIRNEMKIFYFTIESSGDGIVTAISFDTVVVELTIAPIRG